MPMIDITKHIIGDRNRNYYLDIRKWLVENIGEYHGRGEYPVTDIGARWEIVVTQTEPEDDGSVATGWAVDITDENLATMFALVWA